MRQSEYQQAPKKESCLNFEMTFYSPHYVVNIFIAVEGRLFLGVIETEHALSLQIEDKIGQFY